MAKRARRVSPVGVLGLVLLAVLFVAVAWALWFHVGTNAVADADRRDALAGLDEAWRAPTAAESEAELPLPEAGRPAWILEIPALGVRQPIIAGTDPDDLSRGVGWYPTTNLPGEVGNMALAGRRVGHGEPFRRLLDLERGDEVVVETMIKRYTYVVRVAPAELTVAPEDSWVLDPVPGKDFDPHEAVLTLTTEQDLYPTPDRAVGFAVLESEEPK
ncbi:sortase [Tessaracoccus oleiagri]|nr:sortase [Tessaracoccus oleiagri]